MSRYFDKIKEGDRTRLWCIAAFFVPFLLMWIGFAIFEVFPFWQQTDPGTGCLASLFSLRIRSTQTHCT